MGHVTLDFKQIFYSPVNFYWAFEVLSNSLQMLTNKLFYLVDASVATSRSAMPLSDLLAL